MLSLSACNGIFAGIYDAPLPEESHTYGFISVEDKTLTGRIYIDATDYGEWHYIDLHNRTLTTLPVDDDPPSDWDLAIHRYDAKTNSGAVAKSGSASFDALPVPGSIPPQAFVGDEWSSDRITVDMSQMMDGIIVYAEDWYNPCLSGWLDVDTSTMPPIYTLSGEIYLLRLKDGSCAAIRLSNFMNDAAVKGYMTIDYLYPVQLL